MRSLENGEFFPIYVFEGERFFIEQGWKDLGDALERVYGVGRVFRKKISLANIGEEELASFLYTSPLGYSGKLIWLDDLRGIGKEVLKVLMRFFDRPASRTYLVVTLDADSKTTKELIDAARKANSLYVKFSAPKSHQLPRWIQARAKRFGKQISPEGARLIAEVTGADFYAIDSELEKLAVAVGNRKVITEDDLALFLSGARLSSSFEVMDLLASGRRGDALLMLSELLERGEQPIAFLGLLARHVRLLWQVKSAESCGKSLEEIKLLVGLPEFVVSRLMEQGRSFTETQLRELHRGLYEADLKLKTTSIPPLHVLTPILERMKKTAWK